jgi:plastocyanin
MQKVEGNVAFHTAMATAFPQPIPGTAHSAGPLKVPSEELQKVLGITNVHYIAGANHLAVVDSPLAGTPPDNAQAILRNAAAAIPAAQQAQSEPPKAAGSAQASIDNFDFKPKSLTVKPGTTVEWTNKDDTPHTVTSDTKAFGSPILDSNQRFQFLFANAGRFPYHCKLHPMMTGEVLVQA